MAIYVYAAQRIWTNYQSHPVEYEDTILYQRTRDARIYWRKFKVTEMKANNRLLYLKKIDDIAHIDIKNFDYLGDICGTEVDKFIDRMAKTTKLTSDEYIIDWIKYGQSLNPKEMQRLADIISGGDMIDTAVVRDWICDRL